MKTSDSGNNQHAKDKTPQEPAEEIKPIDYLKTARLHLKAGRQKEAYGILLQAFLVCPEEPVILSYFGCLQAIVDRKYRSGIDNCRKALALFKAADAYSAGVIFPALYLNLGRAYVAAGKKREAVEALDKGLKYDRQHSEIRKELQQLGIRKKPPVPFLGRSNPINKYLGLLLHSRKNKTARSS